MSLEELWTYWKKLKNESLRPLKGIKMGVTTCLGGNCGVMFQSIKEFKETIKKNGGAPVNYLMQVGYYALSIKT